MYDLHLETQEWQGVESYDLAQLETVVGLEGFLFEPLLDEELALVAAND